MQVEKRGGQKGVCMCLCVYVGGEWVVVAQGVKEQEVKGKSNHSFIHLASQYY